MIPRKFEKGVVVPPWISESDRLLDRCRARSSKWNMDNANEPEAPAQHFSSSHYLLRTHSQNSQRINVLRLQTRPEPLKMPMTMLRLQVIYILSKTLTGPEST